MRTEAPLAWPAGRSVSEVICGNGKTIHDTRQIARAEAMRAGHTSVYACRFCKGWHTSSADRLSRKDRERRRESIGIKGRRR